MYADFVKRILDFVVAVAMLVLLSWLLLILAVLVAAKIGTPVLFRQERPGRIDSRTGEPRIFTMYKFRTMTDARYTADDVVKAGGEGESGFIVGDLKPDGERLTPFGMKLRGTSLDELPELLNILKGDMSFIGPRPLLVRYLPRYSAEQARRHEVRPGLTGLAQVNGRNAITWERKFSLDVQYAEAVSFAKDCRILAATFRAVTKREGISAEGEATMSEFLGSEDSDGSEGADQNE
jgi:lipopolysaccharide/colanic/teichoic acid biosynthesis glycosyltransferase